MMTVLKKCAISTFSILICTFALVLFAATAISVAAETATAKSHRLSVTGGPCGTRAWHSFPQACDATLNATGRGHKAFLTSETRFPEIQTSILTRMKGPWVAAR